jgi:hypothetical protein
VAQQEAEVCSLNPLARPNGIFGGVGTTRVIPPKPFIHSAAAKGAAAAIPDLSDDEEEGTDVKVTGSCSNSTTTFMPHHLSFVFNCNRRMEFVCLMINVPTGLHTGGLAGKIHALVSPCRTKLQVLCEWPEVLTNSRSLVQTMEQKLEKLEPTKEDCQATIFNMVNAHKAEIEKIRVRQSALQNASFGGTASIPLPFEVEKALYAVTTSVDATTDCVTMVVILRKKTENVTANLDMDLLLTGEGTLPGNYSSVFTS